MLTSQKESPGLSQFDEDAIIARLLEIIGIKHYQCIEFGAWDGLHGSNTARLWKNDNRWKALLIEAEPSRYKRLLLNSADSGAVCVNTHVTIKGEDSIDSLAKRHGFGSDVDLLSIDIDGDDYWIFDSLHYLSPGIIICEYNPTIPPDRHLVGTHGSRIGCSAASLVELANRKGYVLCGATQSNLFFVPAISEQKLTAANIATGTKVAIPSTNLCYVISDYDGNYSFSNRPTYGIRTPKQPLIDHTDMKLTVPHKVLGKAVDMYFSVRTTLHRMRKKITARVHNALKD